MNQALIMMKSRTFNAKHHELSFTKAKLHHAARLGILISRERVEPLLFMSFTRNAISWDISKLRYTSPVLLPLRACSFNRLLERQNISKKDGPTHLTNALLF